MVLGGSQIGWSCRSPPALMTLWFSAMKFEIFFYCMMCVYPKAPDHQRCNCKDVHCPVMIWTSSLISTLSMLCYVIHIPVLPSPLFFVCLWCIMSYFTVHLSQQNSTGSKGLLPFLHYTESDARNCCIIYCQARVIKNQP